MCDVYEPIAEDKAIALGVNIHRKLQVRGDRDLLFEAIANLVDNAVKFTPAGGRVTLELVSAETVALVRVSDTGPGIGEGEREAVLRRFYRSDKMRNTPGVGLGLSLVAAIVKLHGFRLTVCPAPGGRVEILAPLLEAERDATASNSVACFTPASRRCDHRCLARDVRSEKNVEFSESEFRLVKSNLLVPAFGRLLRSVRR